MNNKICTCCYKRKDLSKFYDNKHSKDGKASRCKDCHNAHRHDTTENKVARAYSYYKKVRLVIRGTIKNIHEHKIKARSEEDYCTMLICDAKTSVLNDLLIVLKEEIE